MKFEKKPLLFDEQLAQLKERGLLFTNEDDAELLLSNISYYRLSAYWYPFLKDKSNHVFKDKSNFDAVIQLYEFDQKLRTLLFDAIEVIEVSLRTQIIYTYHIIMELGGLKMPHCLTMPISLATYSEALKTRLNEATKSSFVITKINIPRLAIHQHG